MSKKVQFTDESNLDKQANLEEFRHEQTIKRWKAKNKRKVSKVIYLSDYLPQNNYAEQTTSSAVGAGKTGKVLLSMGSQYEQNFKKSGGIRASSKQLKPAVRADKRNARSKKINFKVKASDSTVPFNHYARHTKLKRRIMALREIVLRELLLSSMDTLQKEQLWYLLLLSEKMKRIYIRVDACMRQKRFSQVKHLKQSIRNVRYTIKRLTEQENFHLTEAQKKKVSSLQDAFYKSIEEQNGAKDEDAEWVAVQEEEECTSSFFAKFDPTLVELALVITNKSVLSPSDDVKIDQRSGRYPVVLSDDALRQFHHHCQYDNLTTTTTFCLSDPFPVAAKGKTHPSQFVAPYCRNIVTDLLDDLAFTTLQKLYHEQKKLKDKQPLQFKSRQRYVVGLQETIKCLRAKQVKLVLLATDMEAFSSPSLAEEAPSKEELIDESSVSPPKNVVVGGGGSGGGGGGGPRRKFQNLVEAVETIQLLCSEETDIPCVVCMSRQRLSYALYAKQSKMSCVGIMHAEQNSEWVKALKLCATAMVSAFPRRKE